MSNELVDLLGRDEASFVASEFIRNLGDYEKSNHEDSFHISYRKYGIEFLFEMDDEEHFYLDTIFFDNSEFAESLLSDLLGADISFEMGRDQIRSLFGSPEYEGATGQRTLLGEVPPWDKFIIKTVFIHFQYEFDATHITKVSVSRV